MSQPELTPEQRRREAVTINVLWLEKSRAQRILWMLEELEMPYNLQAFKRNSEGLAGEDLKREHPLGKSPMIKAKSTSTSDERVIAESGVIVEFLSQHFGSHLIPKQWSEGKEGECLGETEGWNRYRFFMHYAEGSLMTLLILQLTANRIKEAPVPFFLKPITRQVGARIESGYIHPNLALHFAFLEEQLKTAPGTGQFLCGDHLTGADIMMVFPLEAAMGRGGLSKEKYSKLVAYVERILERPAYKKGVERVIKEFGKYETVS